MNKKKRTAKHSTALIFAITLIVSLLILGIVAYIILNIFVFTKNKTENIEIKQNIYMPDAKDNQTILIIGENEGKLEYTSLMFYNAVHSRIMFMPLPTNTFSQVNTKKSTLENFYKKKNQKSLCKAVENLFDISVQKYIEITPSSFNTIVKSTGNISFPLVCDMDYKNPETNEVTHFSQDSKNIFNASDLRKILLYPYYPDGIFQNMYYSGIVCADLVNNLVATSDDVFESLDTIYADAISQSITNIQEYDFNSKRLSFQYMIKKFKTPAIYILPDGNIDKKDYFIMDDLYKNTIHKYICE